MDLALEYAVMYDIYDIKTRQYHDDNPDQALEASGSYKAFIKVYAGNNTGKKITGTIIYIFSKIIAMFAKVAARIYTVFTSLTKSGYTTGSRKLDNKIADMGIEAARNAFLMKKAMTKRWKDTMGVIDKANDLATDYAKKISPLIGTDVDENTRVDILDNNSLKKAFGPCIETLKNIQAEYDATADKVGDQDNKLLNLERLSVINVFGKTFNPWANNVVTVLKGFQDKAAKARDMDGAQAVQSVIRQVLSFFGFMLPVSDNKSTEENKSDNNNDNKSEESSDNNSSESNSDSDSSDEKSE